MPPSRSSAADVLGLCDYSWARLRHRLIGLTDDEWAWRPTADPAVGIRWRLEHLAGMLREERNAVWLGRAPSALPEPKPAEDATAAVAQLEAAFADWRAHLSAMDDTTLRAAVGAPGGQFADSTRLAFALHVVDELIHHGAEAALLRDLYAAR